MKSLMSAGLMLLISTTFYGQDVSLKAEKKNYKIDETIILIFEIKAKVDSESTLSGTNFTLIDGPKKRLSTTSKAGETSTIFTSTYRIKANSPGLVEIISPTFNFDSQAKSAGKFTFKVTEDRLTDLEKDEINFNDFKENSAKQNGSMRYVLSDNFGFIEIFNGSEWEFTRRLSQEEIQNLSKI